MDLKENVLISSLTTMRLGGNAKYVQEIKTVEDIKKSYDFAKSKGMPVYVIGGGSNIIGRDEGFNGLVLLCQLKGIEMVEQEGDTAVIKAYSGEIWDNLIDFVSEKGYSGVEAMSAIPGTVGAAPVQNVGAYGQEVKDVLTNVEAFDTRTNEIVNFSNSECKFDYRRSIFNHEEKGRYFIISITIKVKKGQLSPPFYTSLQNYINEKGITDFSPANISKAVAYVRSQKLPDPKFIPSAGSFFKNVYLQDDEVDEVKARGIQVWRENGKNIIPSGWLIEQSGLKGKVFFGMKVSEKAALILINESAKTYSDLAKARQVVIDTVKDKFGFTLQQEPEEIVSK